MLAASLLSLSSTMALNYLSEFFLKDVWNSFIFDSSLIINDYDLTYSFCKSINESKLATYISTIGWTLLSLKGFELKLSDIELDGVFSLLTRCLT